MTAQGNSGEFNVLRQDFWRLLWWPERRAAHWLEAVGWAVEDHDHKTLRLRLDPQGDASGLDLGMTVWLKR